MREKKAYFHATAADTPYSTKKIGDRQHLAEVPVLYLFPSPTVRTPRSVMTGAHIQPPVRVRMAGASAASVALTDPRRPLSPARQPRDTRPATDRPAGLGRSSPMVEAASLPIHRRADPLHGGDPIAALPLTTGPG